MTPPPDDPRAARSREAILSAVVELLAEEGPGAITHLRVAERAGVGRATVYRHWPQPADLIREVITRVPVPFLDQAEGTLHERLRQTLRRTRDDFSQPMFQTVLISMIDKSMYDEATDAQRRHKLGAVVGRMADALDRALAGGEITGRPNAREIVGRLVGPIFFRVVVQREAMDDDEIDRLIDDTLAPFAP